MKLNPSSKLKKALLNLALGILLFGGTYLVYYFFIGIPKTQARNLYNVAQEYLAINDYENYLLKLNAAYSSWPERYIADELEAYTKLLNTDDQ